MRAFLFVFIVIASGLAIAAVVHEEPPVSGLGKASDVAVELNRLPIPIVKPAEEDPLLPLLEGPIEYIQTERPENFVQGKDQPGAGGQPKRIGLPARIYNQANATAHSQAANLKVSAKTWPKTQAQKSTLPPYLQKWAREIHGLD